MTGKGLTGRGVWQVAGGDAPGADFLSGVLQACCDDVPPSVERAGLRRRPTAASLEPGIRQTARPEMTPPPRARFTLRRR